MDIAGIVEGSGIQTLCMGKLTPAACPLFAGDNGRELAQETTKERDTMKTTTEKQTTVQHASKRSGISETLIRAVIRKTGRENLSDIARHGVDGGFAGFTYYTDTVKFFKSHRTAIMELAEEMASQLGEDCIEMIRNFRCLQSHGKPTCTATEIAEALYRGKGEMATQVQNAMAWFAAEEVARAFDDDNFGA